MRVLKNEGKGVHLKWDTSDLKMVWNYGMQTCDWMNNTMISCRKTWEHKRENRKKLKRTVPKPITQNDATKEREMIRQKHASTKKAEKHS